MPTETSLAECLVQLRITKKMTLRAVEEASGEAISNAYLSQLERGKVKKPSPSILHVLAGVYGVPYIMLMEKSGYITPASEHDEGGGERAGRLPLLAAAEPTDEEESELLKYLRFLRENRKP